MLTIHDFYFLQDAVSVRDFCCKRYVVAPPHPLPSPPPNFLLTYESVKTLGTPAPAPPFLPSRLAITVAIDSSFPGPYLTNICGGNSEKIAGGTLP